jgi:predicted TIM-barrel fold metal-dependent hydrolase
MTNQDVTFGDADQHFYEPLDAFTRFLEPEFRHAIRWVQQDGRQLLLVGDRLFRMIPNPTFDPIAKPGALADYFRGKNATGADTKALVGDLEPIRPEYRNRDRRLAALDAQGVRTAFLLPTLALGIEELLTHDPVGLHGVFRSFNRWLDEDWGFARDHRIMSPAVMTLIDPEAAEKDLNWAIEKGARAVVLRPGPVMGPNGGRSPGDPVYDRFWAMAAEAGIVVAYHAADSGYARYGADWGEGRWFQGYKDSPFTEILSLHIERPIFDTMAALIGHGVFDRHPELRVATVELGSGWVPELLRRLSLSYGKVPRQFGRDPVAAFRAHVWVTPFQEDHVEHLVELLGAEHVLFGSDWPHPEGMHEPKAFLEDIAHLSMPQQGRIMGENLFELLGVA